jgi:hypothetical protein
VDALALLETRWRQVFEHLRDGLDVPPGLRLRTEGAMEALAELGLVGAEEQQQRLADCYRDVLGEPPPADWQRLFPFPQLPGFMARAPVYPSTAD